MIIEDLEFRDAPCDFCRPDHYGEFVATVPAYFTDADGGPKNLSLADYDAFCEAKTAFRLPINAPTVSFDGHSYVCRAHLLEIADRLPHATDTRRTMTTAGATENTPTKEPN